MLRTIQPVGSSGQPEDTRRDPGGHPHRAGLPEQPEVLPVGAGSWAGREKKG